MAAFLGAAHESSFLRVLQMNCRLAVIDVSEFSHLIKIFRNTAKRVARVGALPRKEQIEIIKKIKNYQDQGFTLQAAARKAKQGN